MSEFNIELLALAGGAVLLFILLLVVLIRKTRGRRGFEPVDPRPAPPPPSRATAPVPAPDQPAYAPWRLVSRVLANPDSAGGPLFRLRLMPEGLMPLWEAGAVVRIYCGPAQQVFEPGSIALSPAGDYMVGSLPGEAAIELVVRLCADNGRNEGPRSRWLCQTLQTGHQVALALRDNPQFAPPSDEVPLILIGNATGIAGLHAHIKARPAGTRNWLIFGDRNSADDEVLAAEIADWVSSGHLERCDLVFPGNGQDKRHVTDQIEDAKALLLDWALAGAAVYVCGSGLMGKDVHAALIALLGDEVLDALADAGLYRRLLY